MESSLRSFLNILTYESTNKPGTTSNKILPHRSHLNINDLQENTSNVSAESRNDVLENKESSNYSNISVESLLKSCSAKLIFEIISEIGNQSIEISLRSQSALLMSIQSIFGTNSSDGSESKDLTINDVCTQIATQSVTNQRNEKINQKNIIQGESNILKYTENKIEFLDISDFEISNTAIKKFTQRCLLGVLTNISELFEHISLPDTEAIDSVRANKITLKQKKSIIALRFLFQIIGKYLEKNLTAIVKALSSPLKNPNTIREALITFSVLVVSLKDANLSVSSINCLLSPLIEISLNYTTNIAYYNYERFKIDYLDSTLWEIINDIVVQILGYNHYTIIENWAEICPVPNFHELRGSRSLYVLLSNYESLEKSFINSKQLFNKKDIIEIDLSSSQISSEYDPSSSVTKNIETNFVYYFNKQFDINIENNKDIKQKTEFDYQKYDNETIFSIILKLERLMRNSDFIICASACLELEDVLNTINLSRFIIENSLAPSLISPTQQNTSSDHELVGSNNSDRINSGIKSKKFISAVSQVDLKSKSSKYNDFDSKISRNVEYVDFKSNFEFYTFLQSSIISLIKMHGSKNRLIYISCSRLLGLLGFLNEKVHNNRTLSSSHRKYISKISPYSNELNWRKLGLFNLFIAQDVFNFAHYLILNYLAPLCISSQSPNNQLCLSYSIQEILKLCGFSSTIPSTRADTFYIPKNCNKDNASTTVTQNGRRSNRLSNLSQTQNLSSDTPSNRPKLIVLNKDNSGFYTYMFDESTIIDKWQLFPDNICEILTPLLESRYSIESKSPYYLSNYNNKDFENQNNTNSSNVETFEELDKSEINIPTNSSQDPKSDIPTKSNNITSFYETSPNFELWIQSWLISLINKLPKNIVGKIFLCCVNSTLESPIEYSIALLKQVIMYISNINYYNELGIQNNVLSSFLIYNDEYVYPLSASDNEVISIQDPEYKFSVNADNLFYLVYIELSAVFDPYLQLQMSNDCRKKSIKTVFSIFDSFQMYIRCCPITPHISAKPSINSNLQNNEIFMNSNFNGDSEDKLLINQLNTIRHNLKHFDFHYDKKNPIKNVGNNLTIAQLIFGSIIPFDKMAITAIISGDYYRALLYMEKFCKSDPSNEESQLWLIKFSLLVYVMTFDIDGISGCSINLWKRGIDPNELFSDSAMSVKSIPGSKLDQLKFIKSQVNIDPTRIFRALDTRDWSSSLFRYESNLQVNPYDISSRKGWIDCQQNMGQWRISLSTSKRWLLETDFLQNRNDDVVDLFSSSAWRLGSWDELDDVVQTFYISKSSEEISDNLEDKAIESNNTKHFRQCSGFPNSTYFIEITHFIGP
ncbi:hypothetical protein AYI70_g8152 [Smittium culicis]|uniref:Uncharacterized protein n=1 Tax=Smittium culicis TaxID=133412 RepID=A0A1R1XHA3_9FUNG|nr:hypothetical protein AYI70_g8152 [Smittium culicis]